MLSTPPMSMGSASTSAGIGLQQIAQICERLLDRQIRVRTLPASVINKAGAVLGRFSPMVSDLAAMIRWFQTGRYVAEPTRQREVFGQVPTAEEAIAKLVRSLGHTITANAAAGRPPDSSD
jgi:hypothetical protein